MEDFDFGAVVPKVKKEALILPRVNLLPCLIQYSGPANVAESFHLSDIHIPDREGVGSVGDLSECFSESPSEIGKESFPLKSCGSSDIADSGGEKGGLENLVGDVLVKTKVEKKGDLNGGKKSIVKKAFFRGREMYGTYVSDIVSKGTENKGGGIFKQEDKACVKIEQNVSLHTNNEQINLHPEAQNLFKSIGIHLVETTKEISVAHNNFKSSDENVNNHTSPNINNNVNMNNNSNNNTNQADNYDDFNNQYADNQDSKTDLHLTSKFKTIKPLAQIQDLMYWKQDEVVKPEDEICQWMYFAQLLGAMHRS